MPDATQRWEPAGWLDAPGTGARGNGYRALPCPVVIDTSTVRVFCSDRNESGQAVVGWFDVDLSGPRPQRLGDDFTVVLRPGELGMFDCDGVTMSQVRAVDGGFQMFYTGWFLGKSVPFTYAIGCAFSDSIDGPFKRVSQAPVLGRNDLDPLLAASPCATACDVRTERLWYVSGTNWSGMQDGSIRHDYGLHMRLGEPGTNVWDQDHRPVLEATADEFAFSRAHVRCTNRTELGVCSSQHELWGSVRGEAYALFYAKQESSGIWSRCAVEVARNSAGLDSEMQCYPWVANVGGQDWLFYNGNGYGASGIGVATRPLRKEKVANCG